MNAGSISSPTNLVSVIIPFLCGVFSVIVVKKCFPSLISRKPKNSGRKSFMMMSKNDGEIAHLEAKGADLDIVAVNLNFLKLIQPRQTSSTDSTWHQLPNSVHDLFPADFGVVHRQTMLRVFGSHGSYGLPSSLLHPLRNVEMRRLDGTPIQVDVKIGISNPQHALSAQNTIFHAIITEHSSYSSWYVSTHLRWVLNCPVISYAPGFVWHGSSI